MKEYSQIRIGVDTKAMLDELKRPGQTIEGVILELLERRDKKLERRMKREAAEAGKEEA